MGLLDFFKRKQDLTKVTNQKSKINNFLKNTCFVENDKLFKKGFKEVQDNGETFLIKEHDMGEITETIIFDETFLQKYFFKKDGKINGWYCSLNIRDIDSTYGVNGIVFSLTEGLFINNKKEGEWKDCLFYLGKKYKVEKIRNYKNGELDGFEEEYDGMKMTLEQGELIFKTEYSKGKKHGKRIQYSTYSPWSGNKGGFPVDIQSWEEDEFKSGTKFDVLDGKKLNDYHEL
jgi:hypothetical protein